MSRSRRKTPIVGHTTCRGGPNARSFTHEEVMQATQERIDRTRDKPC